MAENKLSLHLGEKNTTTLSSGFTDQSASDLQFLTVAGRGFGGSGGSVAKTKPPSNCLCSSDAIINDSITRDATGHQTSTHDPDLYYLA